MLRIIVIIVFVIPRFRTGACAGPHRPDDARFALRAQGVSPIGRKPRVRRTARLSGCPTQNAQAARAPRTALRVARLQQPKPQAAPSPDPTEPAQKPRAPGIAPTGCGFRGGLTGTNAPPGERVALLCGRQVFCVLPALPATAENAIFSMHGPRLRQPHCKPREDHAGHSGI